MAPSLGKARSVYEGEGSLSLREDGEDLSETEIVPGAKRVAPLLALSLHPKMKMMFRSR
jgi:hypothetical protein